MKYTITIEKQATVRPGELHNHHTAARLSGISVRTLLHCWNHHIVTPVSNTGRYGIFFDDEAIFRLRQAEYLRREIGVNMNGIQLIMSLKKRIDELEIEINSLKKGDKP
jgi:DNA-binding transcriptional MerR regulator